MRLLSLLLAFLALTFTTNAQMVSFDPHKSAIFIVDDTIDRHDIYAVIYEVTALNNWSLGGYEFNRGEEYTLQIDFSKVIIDDEIEILFDDFPCAEYWDYVFPSIGMIDLLFYDQMMIDLSNIDLYESELIKSKMREHNHNYRQKIFAILTTYYWLYLNEH